MVLRHPDGLFTRHPYPSSGNGGREKRVKIGELLVYIAGAIIGVVLGTVAFLKLYLPLKAWLGFDIAASQALTGEGPIVPMERLVPLYSIAGGAIDLLVLLAFIIAGIYGVVGILRALGEKP